MNERGLLKKGRVININVSKHTERMYFLCTGR